MNKLTLIAAGAAMLMTSAVQAQAHEDGYLPAPAYAAAGGYAGYKDEGPDCGRDAFTILGAHAGATVLGFNAGVGGHFGVGDGCRRHHHYHHAMAAPAYGPPGPPAYPQAPWGAPYAYRAYAPPPPPPVYSPMCGCMRAGGW